jgi:hypothetical protein
MANMLKTARDELKLQLGKAGVTVYDYVPERINPPAAVIEPGSPYVDPGDTFCDHLVRFNVVLFAATSVNKVATDELDRVICDVLKNVDTFDMDGVDQPGSFEVGAQTFLGTRINYTHHSDL